MAKRPTTIAIIGGKPIPVPKPTTGRRALCVATILTAILAASGCGLFQGASTRVTPATSRVDVTTTTEVEINPPKEGEKGAACESSRSSD